MKKLYGILLLVFAAFVCYGQATSIQSGAQILRSARSIYDQGRLHELPVILESAFKEEKFQNDNEKVEAYKILILTYIYIEEPEKADAAMIELLNTDHFFELNQTSDPIEFQNLYRKFRTQALFRVGIRAGVNQTQINTLKNYYVFSESAGKGTYASSLGIQIMAVFEKDFKKKFVIAPEIAYVSQSFTYTNPEIFSVDFADESAEANHILTHTRIQLNALMQYKIAEKRNFTPYVFLGPSVSYLMGANFEGETSIEKGNDVTGQYDNKDSYKPLTLLAIAGAGARLKVGGIYLTADLRYQYGFSNAVDEKQRYRQTEENTQMINRFGYIDNDFTINNAMVSIGLIYPYFKPKKLIK